MSGSDDRGGLPAVQSDIDALFDGGPGGIRGSVQQEIVNRIRKMVDKDPQAFVRGMRGLLHQGRSDE
jgi:hypothetical protein